jgi:hypothetical protein
LNGQDFSFAFGTKYKLLDYNWDVDWLQLKTLANEMVTKIWSPFLND